MAYAEGVPSVDFPFRFVPLAICKGDPRALRGVLSTPNGSAPRRRGIGARGRAFGYAGGVGPRDAASRSSLRRDVALTYANGLLWALGNGLVSTLLVTYLALELGATGTAVAWVVAAPRFAGVLRLASPAVIAAARAVGIGRKQVCLGAFATSAMMLTAVPAVAWGLEPGAPASDAAWRVASLAGAWCVYHVLEHLGGVTLWSWLGDLYPAPLRSRLLGGRERWLAAGRLVGIGASVLLASLWGVVLPESGRVAPLAASASVGTLLMIASLAPLGLVSALRERPSAAPVAPWRSLVGVVAETPYRRLLAYSCWFGFANGLTGAAQGMYPGRVLGAPYAAMQLLTSIMWAGQAAVAPASGRAVRRWGAAPVLAAAQLVVATGPLWFWAATPEAPWWLAAAYVAWVAYAPVNVALDTLKLGLADSRNNAPYLAAYHAVSDLVNGVTTLAGGLMYDTLARSDATALRAYAGLFLAGWVCRTLAAPLALWLREPVAGYGASSASRSSSSPR